MWTAHDAGDILRVANLILFIAAIVVILCLGYRRRALWGHLVPPLFWLTEASLFYVLLIMNHAGTISIEPIMLNNLSNFLRLQIPMMIIGGAVIYCLTDRVRDV